MRLLEIYERILIIFAMALWKHQEKVADNDDTERYELIKSHIRTRAVENVTYTLTVNSTYPYQTAPTGIYDKSGCTIKELNRNVEDLLIFDFNNTEDDFGEKGRRSISNQLTDRFIYKRR